MKIRIKEDKSLKLDYFKVQKLIKEIFEKEGPNRPKGPNPEAYQKDNKQDSSFKDKDKKKKDPNAPTFPMDYILFKFPNIKTVLTELLTTMFSDYIDNIFVMAPKPTTFKVVLKNKQDFLIIYNERSYIIKVSGKKYYMLNLSERESAIKAIANLLNSKRFITSKNEEDENKSSGPEKESGAKLGRPKGSGSSGGSSSPSKESKPEDKNSEELPELPDDILKGLEGGGETTGEPEVGAPEEEPLAENFQVRITTDPTRYTISIIEQFSDNLELEQFQQQLSEDQAVEEITAEEAADLIINAGNSMFTVEFTKKDGSHRILNGRREVKKHLKGGSLPFDPKEKGLITVYDMHAPVGTGYRLIPKESIVALRINGKNYRVVKKNSELKEIQSLKSLNENDKDISKNLAKKKYFINQAVQNKIQKNIKPGVPPSSDKQLIQNIEYYQQLLQQSRLSPKTREFVQGIINNIKQNQGLASSKQLSILQKFKIGGLQEIQIKSHISIVPKEYLNILEYITRGYGDYNSGFDLYKPYSEIYRLEDNDIIDDESMYNSIYKICKNLGGIERIYLMKDLLNIDPPKNNSEFRTLIKIGLDYIEVLSPDVSMDGGEYVGWFDYKGNYVPDVKNFDEEGNKII